jgi:hypothetical protein
MGGNVGKEKNVRNLILVVGLATTYAARASSDSVYVVVHGDTAVICNVDVPHYCNSTFSFDVSQSHDTICVVETDTARMRVRCVCTFELSATATGLQPGPYVAAVYRRYSPVHGYPTDTTYFVDAVPFVIQNPAGVSSQHFFQSPCIRYLQTHEPPELPLQFSLSQNYPNPFNPSTTIQYSLPSQRLDGAQGRVGVGSHVTLKVYDVLGREVATLVNETKQPGTYTVQFDGSSLASGVYFYRLHAGSYTNVKRMLLLR